MEVRQFLWLLGLFPVGDEVCQCLRLDCLSWLVFDVVDADLDGPLGDPPGRLAIADDVLQWC